LTGLKNFSTILIIGEFMYINGYNRKKVMEVIKKNNLGRKSVDEWDNCLYSSPDNNKCLVGCFIPDELYNEEMENKSVDNLLKFYPELREHMPMDTFSLTKLQTYHDYHISYETDFFGAILKELKNIEKTIDFNL
jgi:hypothetical protein